MASQPYPVYRTWESAPELGESVIYAQSAAGAARCEPPIALGSLAVNPLVPTVVTRDGLAHVAVWLDATSWPSPAHFLVATRCAALRIPLRRCGGTESVFMRHLEALRVGSSLLFIHAHAGSETDAPAFFAWAPIDRLLVAGPEAERIAKLLRAAQQPLPSECRLSVAVAG